MTLAHPLQWPITQPRAKYRERSRFQVSLAQARDDLYRELELLGATAVTISSNAALNLNGTISARQGFIADPGVAVYWKRNGREQVMACDRWDQIGHNIRAIGKTIEALRGIERWGTTEMVDAAFSGFAALPETASGASWWSVLAVSPTSGRDAIERAFRELSRTHHPDVGGDAEQFLRVQEAYRQGLAAAS